MKIFAKFWSSFFLFILWPVIQLIWEKLKLFENYLCCSKTLCRKLHFVFQTLPETVIIRNFQNSFFSFVPSNQLSGCSCIKSEPNASATATFFGAAITVSWFLLWTTRELIMSFVLYGSSVQKVKNVFDHVIVNVFSLSREPCSTIFNKDTSNCSLDSLPSYLFRLR